MNELLFCIQAFAVFGFTVLAAKRGWLAGWMGLLTILANLFVTKQITLFGLEVTASDVYAVGLFLSLNILQEYLWFFGWVKRRYPAVSFNLRNFFCLLISQALDTLVFTFLGLYGIVADLVDVMMWSFFVKGIITSAVPLLTPYLRRYVVQV